MVLITPRKNGVKEKYASNIAQRALLFVGDEELLVLSETLNADKPPFIQRWYPSEKNNTLHNNMFFIGPDDTIRI